MPLQGFQLNADAFDVSAVPVVKVSGPLLRLCSKAVSTILSDPDMIWFVSPGGFSPPSPLFILWCDAFRQWTTKRCSFMIIPRL